MPLLIVMAEDNSPFFKGDLVCWNKDGNNDVGIKIATGTRHRVIKTDLTELECIDLEQGDIGFGNRTDFPDQTNLRMRKRKINFNALPANKRARLVGARRSMLERFDAGAPKGQQHTQPWDEEIPALDLRNAIENKIIVARII